MTAAVASFAEAFQTLTSTRRGAAERRRFRRLEMPLTGRMMDAQGREHDCRTADVSPGDVRILANAEVAVGDRIVFYFDELGRLEGTVARRCSEGEYAIVLSHSAHKREKLAEILTWLINRNDMAPDETRRADRKSGQGSQIQLEDGGMIEGEILDFSLVGMAVRSRQTPPPIGAWVRVGGIYGKVARYIEGGFAIDFERRT